MSRVNFAAALIAALATAGLVASSAAAASGKPTGAGIPTNVDASQWHHNESEGAIAVNPTNPNNIVIVTNVDYPAAGMFEGVSFDGGTTWTSTLIGNGTIQTRSSTQIVVQEFMTGASPSWIRGQKWRSWRSAAAWNVAAVTPR